MAKEELTLEELKERKIRRSNGWTRFWAIVLAFVLVAGVSGVAYKQAGDRNAEIAEAQKQIEEEMAAQQSFDGAQTGDNNPGGAQSADANAPASNEAEEAAKAINAATAAGATAGYKWVRTSDYTQPIDVGGATDTLNKVIHMADPNANLDSVVGGFIGIGKKEATINKGEDAATVINYHGAGTTLRAESEVERYRI